MAFIDGKKYRQLVEAMNNGDEKAKAILIAQYNGKDDEVNNLLGEYFSVPETPQNEPEMAQPEPEPVAPEKKPITYQEKMQKFLNDNGIHEGDEEYDLYVEEYKKENPETDECETVACESLDEKIQMLVDDEIEAVKGYDDAIVMVASGDYTDSERKGIMAIFEEIKNDELEHIEKLKRLKNKNKDKQPDIENM